MKTLRIFIYFFLLLQSLLLFPFRLDFKNIHLKQNNERFFSAKLLTVHFRPFDLLFGKVVFNEIYILDGILHKLPQSSKPLELNWPTFACALEIRNIVAKNFTIEPKIFNKPFQGDFESYLKYSKNKDFDAKLSFQNEGHYSLSISGEYETQKIFLLAHTLRNEESLFISASGDINSWNQILCNLSDPNLDINGKIAVHANIPEAYCSIGKKFNFKSSFKLCHPLSAQMTDLLFESEHLYVKGHANACATELIDSELFIHHNQLDILKNGLEGKLFLNGKFQGPWDDLSCQCDFFTDQLHIFQLPFLKDIKGSFLANLKQKRISLNASTAWKEDEILYSSDLTLNENNLIQINNLKAQFLDTLFSGDIVYDYKNQSANGNLNFNCEQILSWKKIFPELDVEGNCVAKCQLINENAKQNLQAHIDAHQLQYKTYAASSINLKASIDDLYQNWKMTFSCETDGVYKYPFSLTVKGYAYQNVFCLEQFFGKLKDIDFASSKPLEFHYDKDLYQCVDFQFKIGQNEGRVLGTINLSPNKSHIQIDVNNLPIECVTLFNPDWEGKGVIEGQINLFQEDFTTNGDFCFKVKNPQTRSYSLPYSEFVVNGNYHNHHFEFQCLWEISNQSPIYINGKLPFNFALFPFHYEYDRKLPISLLVQAKSSLDPILQQLPIRDLNLSGNVEIDININGTFLDPQIAGYVRFDDGYLEIASTGALFDKIACELVCQNNILTVQSFHAQDRNKGNITGKGIIKFDLKDLFLIDLQLNAEEFLFIELNDILATVNAELYLKGNAKQLNLYGNANLVEGFLYIPDHQPTTLTCLPFTYINDFSPQEEKSSTSSSKQPLNIDITIDIPNHFILEGRGLSSEWQGKLFIQGQPGSIAVHGNLEAVKGSFEFIDRHFELISGKIALKGLNPKDIFINLNAQLKLPAHVITATLKGPANSSEISLLSNPSLKTNEILCWILFNTDVSEITPFQAMQLANTLISSSGSYKTANVLNKVKSMLGLDVLDISSSGKDKNNFAFQAGKYFTDRLFIGMSKSISGEGDALNIQAKVTKRLTLQAQMGRSANGKLIFKWAKAY